MSPGETPGLHRAVASAAGFYDELCWLDTADFEKPFDFARARNRNLEMATGQYVLILDDDEYFVQLLNISIVRDIFKESDEIISLINDYEHIQQKFLKNSMKS